MSNQPSTSNADSGIAYQHQFQPQTPNQQHHPPYHHQHSIDDGDGSCRDSSIVYPNQFQLQTPNQQHHPPYHHQHSIDDGDGSCRDSSIVYPNQFQLQTPNQQQQPHYYQQHGIDNADGNCRNSGSENLHRMQQLPSTRLQQQIQMYHQQQQHSSSSSSSSSQPVPYIPRPQDPPQLRVQYIFEELQDETCHRLLTNFLGYLWSLTTADTTWRMESCRALSSSTPYINRLRDIINDPRNKSHNLILCLAIGSLTSLTKYDWGCAAIVNNEGVIECLINSIQATDSDAPVFAITPIHKLLSDSRFREAVKRCLPVEYIIRLLNFRNPSTDEYQIFETLVLDCIYFIAYEDELIKSTIQTSGGTRLIIQTIETCYLGGKQDAAFVETASRLLKALSYGASVGEIVPNGGINILLRFIESDDLEVVGDSLWTLKNLSHLLNNSTEIEHSILEKLVYTLIKILRQFPPDPYLVGCALCTLENLTYNNQPVKQMICSIESGVELILNTIALALRNYPPSPDNDILEPVLCTLCNLLNQDSISHLNHAKETIRGNCYIRFLMQQADQVMSAELKPKLMKISKRLT